MKKGIVLTVLILLLLIVLYQIRPVKQTVISLVTSPSYLNKEGLTVKSRVSIPEGYFRDSLSKHSFEYYVRNQKLKAFGAKVINYDSTPYFYQLGHVGVLNISVPKNGLQQCADALIRIRSEYLWSQNQKNKIGFEFTSGHYCSWIKYAEGYRPKVAGSKVGFHKTAKANHTKANFYKYLNLIYMYSGTLSLNVEMKEIKNLAKLKIGDMLILGGSPGHVIMIADKIKNQEGDLLFLFIQGNTPAQSVHMLKNLSDASISPWYELDLSKEVSVPGYTFDKPKFIRFK